MKIIPPANSTIKVAIEFSTLSIEEKLLLALITELILQSQVQHLSQETIPEAIQSIKLLLGHHGIRDGDIPVKNKLLATVTFGDDPALISCTEESFFVSPEHVPANTL